MTNYDPVNRILSGRRVPQVYHEFSSVGQVALHVLSYHPHKILQVNDDDGISLTSTQIAEMMTNIAKNLYRLGLRSGDIAGFCLSNTTYVAPLVFGCLLLRLPINPADKLFEVDEIVTIYSRTKPKIIFCDHDNVDKIMEVLEEMESDAVIVTMTERVGNLNHISDLMRDCFIDNDSFMYNIPTDLIAAFIVCTSGSTGNPKLAMISHIQQLQLYMWFDDIVEIKFSYCPASLFWLNGFAHIVFRTLNTQKRLITAKPFSPDLFFNLIEKYRINEASLYTPLLKLLVESPKFESADFSCFDMISSGGFATPLRFCQIFREKLVNGKFVVGYGLSETGGVSTKVITPSSTSSVGAPFLNTDVKIQLDDGTTGGIREIGEVLVRHPIKFFGYFNNEPSNKVDADDWYHTGDMGYIDENYELNIVGQRTLVIKNLYCEIYPFEIENRIEAVPGVKQVVVVGTPDLIELYVPTALIVKDKNSDVNDDLINEAVSDLPHYQRLNGGIFFVDELPVNSSRKIKRNEAKELAVQLKMERLSLEN